jgi:hypothetical protein
MQRDRGIAFLPLLTLGLFPPVAPAAASAARTHLGRITDTECGADHGPMIGRGGMGRNTASCTRGCVARGATYGFVDRKGRLYQLDDQAKPARFAGKRVRLLGRIEGDTIYVEKIEPVR